MQNDQVAVQYLLMFLFAWNASTIMDSFFYFIKIKLWILRSYVHDRSLSLFTFCSSPAVSRRRSSITGLHPPEMEFTIVILTKYLRFLVDYFHSRGSFTDLKVPDTDTRSNIPYIFFITAKGWRGGRGFVYLSTLNKIFNQYFHLVFQ